MTDQVYVAFGRCRSGRRWFWTAAELHSDSGHKCDDPVCIYGGPHEYGWEDSEDQALAAMNAAVLRLGAEPDGNGRAGTASAALKRINAARRAARPQSAGKNTAVTEYLYGAFWSSWIDDETGGHIKHVTPFPVTRTTPRRIWYVRRDAVPEWNDPPLTGYIDRLAFESDTRCPGGAHRSCEHGYRHDHGEGPGEIRTNHHHDDDAHLFATREAAEAYLFEREREQERRHKDAEPGLKRLRAAMVKAHPDSGGSHEAFLEAHAAYEQALRRAS